MLNGIEFLIRISENIGLLVSFIATLGIIGLNGFIIRKYYSLTKGNYKVLYEIPILNIYYLGEIVLNKLYGITLVIYHIIIIVGGLLLSYISLDIIHIENAYKITEFMNNSIFMYHFMMAPLCITMIIAIYKISKFKTSKLEKDSVREEKVKEKVRELLNKKRES